MSCSNQSAEVKKYCVDNLEKVILSNGKLEVTSDKVSGVWFYTYSNPDDKGHKYSEECVFENNGTFSCDIYENGCFDNGFCEGNLDSTSGVWTLKEDNFTLSDMYTFAGPYLLLSISDDHMYIKGKYEKRAYFKTKGCG